MNRILRHILGFFLIIIGFLGNPMILIFPMWTFTSLYKEKIKQILNKYPLPVVFLGSGVFFGLLTETFAIFENLSKPLEERILLNADPISDLIMAIFYYSFVMFAWYIIIKRYKTSKKEVFFLTGLYGILVEEMGGVFLRIFLVPIFGPIYAIFITFVYGIFPMLAYMLTQHRFENQKEIKKYKKYLIIAFVLFLQWAIYGNTIYELFSLIF